MRFKTESAFFYLLFKWLIICLTVGILAGSSSALFLISLEFVTHYRENHPWILFLLPLGGLLIGLLYFYFGKEVAKGNNLILQEYENATTTIPLKMAPLVLIGTLITHLFGGSAGREGTAVQMSSTIADQFSVVFKLSKHERRTLLIIGISAGFASVFGTPLTGAIFAIEVLYFSKINYKSIIPSFIVAYIAYFTVEFWQVSHTHYNIPNVPSLDFTTLFWVILAGILFGLTSMLFSKVTRFFAETFSKYIKYRPLRPFLGGIIFVAVIYFSGATQFLGLGIPTIISSFEIQQDFSVFILKILFTAFTLGVGFKGGEVTPLFFIGATLGSALSFFIPLPIALLAGMGFVAVFSGATHTPIACTVMGIELFGYDCGIYVGIACVFAYFCSGYIGIYESQIVKGPKHHLYQKFNSKKLENL